MALPWAERRLPEFGMSAKLFGVTNVRIRPLLTVVGWVASVLVVIGLGVGVEAGIGGRPSMSAPTSGAPSGETPQSGSVSGTLEYTNAPAPAPPHPGAGVISFDVAPLVELDECGTAQTTCEPQIPPPFLTIQVARNGRFLVQLPPGIYGISGSVGPASCGAAAFTVRASRQVRVDIVCRFLFP